MLGVRPTWDGLEIDPCLPEQLLPAKVTRVFRGCRYEITITKNQKLLLPHVDGRKQLTVQCIKEDHQSCIAHMTGGSFSNA